MACAIAGGVCSPNANPDRRWNLASLLAALPSMPLNISSWSRVRPSQLLYPQYSIPYYKPSQSRCKPQVFSTFTGLCPTNPIISLGDYTGFGDDFTVVLNGDRAFCMRHRKRKYRLRASGPRKALLRHLTTEILKHGRIKTTITKAKAVRPFVDKMITLAKNGSVVKRKEALGFIYDKNLVHSLFAEAPERYGDRPGGYTRIFKTFTRLGDGAPMAYIELV